MRVVALPCQGGLQVADRLAHLAGIVGLDHRPRQCGADRRPVRRKAGGFTVGRNGGGAAPPLEHHLPLQLMQPGVAGLLGQQPVDDAQRLVGMAQAIQRYAAGIAGGGCGVVLPDAPQRDGAGLQEAAQLGPHHLEPGLEAGRQGRVGVWAAGEMGGDGLDPIAREGVGAQIGVLQVVDQRILVLHAPEQGGEATGRPAELLQRIQGRLVGRALHAAREAHQPALGQLLAAEDGAHPRLPAAAGHARGHTDQHGGDRLDHRLAHHLRQAGEMAAADMAGLVRQHADQLQGGIGLGDDPAVDEQAVAGADEGV